MDFDTLATHYHNRIPRSGSHLPRMPMTVVPPKLLRNGIANSGPNGSPEMTWGQALTKAIAEIRLE
jgi:hypothetical protein